MSVSVFNAAKDRSRWQRVLFRLPFSIQDIYYQPEYVLLYQSGTDILATMFVYEQAGELWVYPFLLKRILQIGDLILEHKWYDIETPYGYGGPIASTEDADFLAQAHKAFSKWCKANGIVTEFLRLHPLLQTSRWLDNQVETINVRKTVSIDLAEQCGIDLSISTTGRYMVRRAKKSGVRVVVYPAENQMDRFLKLYLLTMDKLKANDFYYFNNDYFTKLGKLINRFGWLLVAQRDSEWLAAALFLKGTTWLHYHLSATDTNKRVPGVVNRLIYTAAQLGRRQGLQRLHLGGGRSSEADDSLLAFKKSMATDTHTFRIGRRVHNDEAYSRFRYLLEGRFSSQMSKCDQRFPFYRWIG